MQLELVIWYARWWIVVLAIIAVAAYVQDRSGRK